MSYSSIKIMVDAVRECVESGMTAAETANSIGISAAAVGKIARDNGFPFARGRARGRTDRCGEKSARNIEFVERFNAGQTLEAIAQDFGVTRERVRQVVTRMGCKPRYEATRERMDAIVEAARNEWLTASELAEKFCVKVDAVYRAATLAGIDLPKWTKGVEDDLAAHAARVAAGESIHSIAGGDRALAGRIRYYCNIHGIKSLHGKWRDFSHREGIIREGRNAGDTWDQIAARLGPIEGFAVAGNALATWAYNNLDRVPRLVRKPCPPKPPRAKRDGRPAVCAETPDADVILKETVRETAIVNRGRVPASKIAAALGVTRNSIIGHWNRARQDGAVA